MNNFAEARLSSRYRSLLFESSESPLSLFGFECLDGWEDLIDGALHLVRQHSRNTKLDPRITTVKEKFGQLRFYHLGGDEIVDLVLDITEMVSSRVCELCGEPGNLIEMAGWLQARCEKHRGRQMSGQITPKPRNELYVSSYVRSLTLILWFFRSEALGWVQQESMALGGARPYEALATVDGCEDVYLLLKRIAHGVGV